MGKLETYCMNNDLSLANISNQFNEYNNNKMTLGMLHRALKFPNEEEMDMMYSNYSCNTRILTKEKSKLIYDEVKNNG